MATRKKTTVTKTPADTGPLYSAIGMEEMTLRIIGMTPLYFNAMSAKAKRDLLVGGRKKTAAERKLIKHNPLEEFRNSLYVAKDGPTRIVFPAPGIKQAMATAALETPGAKKTSVQRLIFMPEHRIHIFGNPFLKMDVVRSADINKTPDVRTRAILPFWGAEIKLRYMVPGLTAGDCLNLLSNAGYIIGIGDFRQEKGRGSFGTFVTEMASNNQLAEEWAELQKQGRVAQEKAIDRAEPFDEETADLLDFYRQEQKLRAVS